MANVAEKARFHLERAVPQLREFEDKEIFDRDEIRILVSKRSEFEHLVLGPGCKPQHFQAYVTWELSLDRLRAKRCLRKKIKSSTSHSSHARLFGIFERAVQRHPGSLELWTAYLDYAKSVGATKRWRKIMTQALRLHPLNLGLWMTAGRRAAADGDMGRARGLFMRGCRFCNTTVDLWLEYARVEMDWLAGMERKKAGAKGLAAVRAEETVEAGDVLRFDDDEDDDAEDGDGNDILLAALADEEDQAARRRLADDGLKKLEKSPALAGAIPKAIFDDARKQPFFGAPAAEAFFNMFATFTTVSVQPAIIQHVLDTMIVSYPTHPATCVCVIRHPLIGVDVTNIGFPTALREVLARLKTQMETTQDKAKLLVATLAWVESVLKREDLDANIRTVLEHTRQKLASP